MEPAPKLFVFSAKPKNDEIREWLTQNETPGMEKGIIKNRPYYTLPVSLGLEAQEYPVPEIFYNVTLEPSLVVAEYSQADEQRRLVKCQVIAGHTGCQLKPRKNLVINDDTGHRSFAFKAKGPAIVEAELVRGRVAAFTITAYKLRQKAHRIIMKPTRIAAARRDSPEYSALMEGQWRHAILAAIGRATCSRQCDRPHYGAWLGVP